MSKHEKVEQWCPHCLNQLIKVVETGFTFCDCMPHCEYEVHEGGDTPLDHQSMLAVSIARMSTEIERAERHLWELRTHRTKLIDSQKCDWRRLLTNHLDGKPVGYIVCVPEQQLLVASRRHPYEAINFWLGTKEVVDQLGIWILLSDKRLDITDKSPVYAFIKLDTRGLVALSDLECCTYTNLVAQ